MWMALHVAFRKHIHLTAIFLHRSSSLDKCLKEVCVALEVTRSEDSQVAHNIVRCSLILKALRDEDQSFSSTPSTQTQLMWSEGTWGFVTLVRVSTVVSGLDVDSNTSMNWDGRVHSMLHSAVRQQTEGKDLGMNQSFPGLARLSLAVWIWYCKRQMDKA